MDFPIDEIEYLGIFLTPQSKEKLKSLNIPVINNLKELLLLLSKERI